MQASGLPFRLPRNACVCANCVSERRPFTRIMNGMRTYTFSVGQRPGVWDAVRRKMKIPLHGRRDITPAGRCRPGVNCRRVARRPRDGRMAASPAANCTFSPFHARARPPDVASQSPPTMTTMTMTSVGVRTVTIMKR